MLDTNHKNPACRYAEQIVSHLYGEGDAAEKALFDAHLPNCTFCADELKNFNFVRSAISEWRVEEFSNMATPVFEIQTIDKAKSVTVVTNSTESNSFFGGLKNLFSLKPAFAAFAFLIACAAIAFVVISFSGGFKEIASNQIDKNAEDKIVSPIDKIKEIPDEINLAEEKTEKSPTLKNVESPPEVKIEIPTMPNKTIVKASNNPAKVNTVNPNSAPKQAKDTDRKTPTTQKRQIPTLTINEVEEDDSIRLADLFDEIDAR